VLHCKKKVNEKSSTLPEVCKYTFLNRYVFGNVTAHVLFVSPTNAVGPYRSEPFLLQWWYLGRPWVDSATGRYPSSSESTRNILELIKLDIYTVILRHIYTRRPVEVSNELGEGPWRHFWPPPPPCSNTTTLTHPAKKKRKESFSNQIHPAPNG
jgi:hypothetical protein